MAEQSNVLADIRDSLGALDSRVGDGFARLDKCTDRLEHRVDRFEQRVDVRFEGLDKKIDALDSKVSAQFMWIVGILVTTLAALFVAVLAR